MQILWRQNIIGYIVDNSNILGYLYSTTRIWTELIRGCHCAHDKLEITYLWQSHDPKKLISFVSFYKHKTPIFFNTIQQTPEILETNMAAD